MSDAPREAAPLPPLRPDLELMPAERKGKPVFLARFPGEDGKESLALNESVVALASLFDGEKSAQDIASAIAKETGTIVPAARIADIAEQLAAARLLETPEVAEARRRDWQAFKNSLVRPMVCAAAYPSQGLELASFMGKFFIDPKGPGKPLAGKPAPGPAPVGLVAPHIDLPRGGPCYAWSYQALSESPPPDLIVALGVAHASPDSPWVLTRKAYETPYGPMAVCDELYRAFQAELWYEGTADEWVHREEHSLEFQALWLKYLWKDAAPPWLPVLCSSLERFAEDRPPSSFEAVEKAIAGIGRRLAEIAQNKRVLILAGVDLAHVGPHFGDDLKLGSELEKKVEGEDRKSLDLALSLKADDFYMSVVADGHWRKVCGLSALYVGTRLIAAVKPDARGTLLSYGQAPDPRGGLVSFAGAIYT